MENENKDKKNMDIELPADVASGIYSNLQIVQHSQTEFVLDFVQIAPGVPKAQVKSRIILAPMHAKRLLAALQDNLNRYEQQHGRINDLSQTYDLGAKGPMGMS